MADLAYFVYCESIDEMPDGKMSIRNPFVVMNPLFVPGMYSYSVAIAIRNANKEGNELQIIMKNEEGEIINDTDIVSIPPLQEKDTNGSPLHGLRLSIDFRNVPFKKRGIYCSTVMLNGEKLGEFPIMIEQAGEGNDSDL